MRFTFVQQAKPDTIFACNAFNSSVGKTIRVNLPGRRDRDGTLVKAEVSGDGRSVELTCEVDDSSEVASILNPRYDHRDISVGFTPPADEADRWPGGDVSFKAVEAKPAE